MTLQDVAIIERIVRQSSIQTKDPDEMRFESWLGVDQDQALALLDMIPGKLPCGPLSRWWQELHPCAMPNCVVSIGKDETYCLEHGGRD